MQVTIKFAVYNGFYKYFLFVRVDMQARREGSAKGRME